jgi:hypothetical protein
MAEEANSPKGEFIGAVTGLKPGPTEFGHPLDQSSQARHHHGLTRLSLTNKGSISLFTHNG